MEKPAGGRCVPGLPRPPEKRPLSPALCASFPRLLLVRGLLLPCLCFWETPSFVCLEKGRIIQTFHVQTAKKLHSPGLNLALCLEQGWGQSLVDDPSVSSISFLGLLQQTQAGGGSEGGLKQWMFIVSQFWRPESEIKVWGGPGFLWRLQGRTLPASPASGGSRSPLVCGCITPPLPLTSHGLHLCVCGSNHSLIRTPVIWI